MVKDNEDGTKQYAVTSADKVDLRKKIFEILPKQDITIFELKKDESTLEDAFIKLIDSDQKEEANKDESKEKISEKEEKKAKKQSKGGKE